jgi:hypothetical protein
MSQLSEKANSGNLSNNEVSKRDRFGNYYYLILILDGNIHNC